MTSDDHRSPPTRLPAPAQRAAVLAVAGPAAAGASSARCRAAGRCALLPLCVLGAVLAAGCADRAERRTTPTRTRRTAACSGTGDHADLVSGAVRAAVLACCGMCRRPTIWTRVEKICAVLRHGRDVGHHRHQLSHELMHQKIAAGALAGRPAAGHRCSTRISASEHLRVHHLLCRHPARPGDGALQRGVPPLLPARAARSAARRPGRPRRRCWPRKGLPWHHRRNPFWRYAALQGGDAAAGAGAWRLDRAWPVPLAGRSSRSGSWSW